MVEREAVLDRTFGSLANASRRDMLRRVAAEQLSVSELSESYDLTFAAVSKHLKVLEDAHLITRERRGKLHLVRLAPEALAPASAELERYKELWEDRLDSLERYLKTLQ